MRSLLVRSHFLDPRGALPSQSRVARGGTWVVSVGKLRESFRVEMSPPTGTTRLVSVAPENCVDKVTGKPEAIPSSLSLLSAPPLAVLTVGQIEGFLKNKITCLAYSFSN